MDKALFFRNCSNYLNYYNNINNLNSFGTYFYYTISKIIILSENEYNHFINNFSQNYDFISNSINKMHMDEKDVLSCLFVTHNLNQGYLVYSAGYNYARYIAFLDKSTSKVL